MNMQAGDTYRNFLVKSSIDLQEINSRLLEFEHRPLGASIMMIVNDDDENVFNICFRTTPNNSTGVAHILEHMALCGSRNYPVRDPFFSMTRRSLHTFMNAFTGSDFTCYPAASQISEDFYNLLSIYIDAAFYPLLSDVSFLQEGWRYEKVGERQLQYAGIVFNEMKGALMSGESRLMEALNSLVYPDVTYGINSGGDPKDIVRLQASDVRKFHETQYNLSRCLFYFYGNIKPTTHLDFLEEKLLRHFPKVDRQTTIVPAQKRFKEPVRETLSYPVGQDDADKALFGITWLTCSILDQQELLALNVLDIILMGTDASLLKKTLLRSGLCKQTDMILDNDVRDIPITIICKGCSPLDAHKLETLIMARLSEIVTEGIPDNLIQGAVHQLELSRKEIAGCSLPYGLSLFFRSGLLKLHGGNPSDGLRIHSLFAKLREDVQNPRYLLGLIEKHFLQNTHFARVILLPDQELNRKEVEQEQVSLNQIVQSWAESDWDKIEQQSHMLEEYQSTHEDVSQVLPSLSIGRIPHNGKEFMLEKEAGSTGSVLFHECFTNDIVYTDLVFTLPRLREEELPLFRLLVFLLPQLGCAGRSYKEQLEFLLECTGGIDVVYDFSPHATNCDHLTPSMSFRGKSLAVHTEKLFSVLRELVTEVDFSDEERIRELLMQHHDALTASVRNSPMSYAINVACRSFSTVSKMTELCSGLSYVQYITRLMQNIDQGIQPLVAQLRALYSKCTSGQYQCVLSCSRLNLEELKAKDYYGLSLISRETRNIESWENPHIVMDRLTGGFEIPVQAAFNVLALPVGSLAYDHPDAAVLTVVAEMLDNVVLHTKIREQGGAYGSGSALNLNRSVFYCYSYRDPEIANTYKSFREGIQTIADGLFNDKDIQEGILSVIQSIDSPVSPGARASVAYFRLRSGRIPGLRQAFRQAVLSVTRDQVTDVVKRYLLQSWDAGVFVSFSCRDLLERKSRDIGTSFPVQASI